MFVEWPKRETGWTLGQLADRQEWLVNITTGPEVSTLGEVTGLSRRDTPLRWRSVDLRALDGKGANLDRSLPLAAVTCYKETWRGVERARSGLAIQVELARSSCYG